MNDEPIDIAKVKAFIDAQVAEAKKQEDRFNELMDQIFKLHPELVLMKLDLALRLHKQTILISAELEGREDEARKAMDEISSHVDKIMVENEKILRTELIKARARGGKKNDGDSRTMGPRPGYT